MKCINPEVGEMIFLYQFNQLNEAERKRFEAHLLQCDYCFQEAYALQPVVERMKENPQPFLKELSRPVPSGVLSRLKSRWIDLADSFTVLPTRRKLSLAGAIGLAVLLLFLFLPKSPPTLQELASIERHPFQAGSLMGTVGQTEAERHFLRGMEYYNKGDYSLALESLRSAVTLDSTDAEFQFFLGVTYLLLDSTESAIELLHTAASIPSRFEARSRWYLGNAYLLLGDGMKALAEFQAVVRLGGIYAKHAEEMAGKVEAVIK